jgi:ATP-binding cassette subfamily B protein
MTAERTEGPSQGEGGGPLRTQSLHRETLVDRPDLSLLRRLIPYMRPYRGLLLLALLLMPVTSGMTLLEPYLAKLAVDAILVDRSFSLLMEIVAWFAGVIVLAFFAHFAQTYAMQLAGQRAMGDLRMTVFRHIQRLRTSYFDRTPIGRVVTRVTNDVDTLSELFASGAVMAVADVLMLIGIVIFMLSLEWRLSLVAFAALPPLAVLVNIFRKFARKAFRDIRGHLAQLNAYLNEQVNGIAVVQAFGRERACASEYGQINDAYREANFRSIRYDALLYSVVESVSVASIAIVLWYASVRVGLVQQKGAAAQYVGTVVAFYEYIQRFFVPIRDLASKYTIIQSSLASAERIFGLLDVQEFDAPAQSGERGERTEQTSEPEPGAAVDDNVGLALRDVTFAYKPGYPVLRDVSIEIQRGEKVALVGATGAGKTTVTSLLLRLHEPQDGDVLVGGRDVRHWDRHALRQQFAVVPQEVFLFGGTVLDNVALGDPTPDRDRAEHALARVGADAVVASRGGLEAQVDERGANFSAGECQLLAFARAVYRDAPALILDEATAHVDSETEARLQRAVLELLEGRTAVVIAHRLSTIQHVDRIVVFHHGRVVETGTHQELLRHDGIYARLYRLQFGGEAA